MNVKTILIAEDDFDLAHLLTVRCRQLGLNVFRSPDAMHALLGVHRARPSVILLDVNMPAGNGLTVCEMLAGDPELSAIPVIVMSGQSDAATAERCRKLGARYVMKGPNLWTELSAIIQELTGLDPQIAGVAADASSPDGGNRGGPARPKVLCIDDDAEITELLKLRLEAHGVDVLRAFSGMQGYWSCLDSKPDLIITDMTMPDGDGAYIMYRLRSHPLTEKTPVIVLTGHSNAAMKRQMLAMGVSAFLMKPLVFDDLLKQLEKHLLLAAGHGKSRKPSAVGS